MKHKAPSSRRVTYAASPLLAAKTPPGRSRFVVALVALAFAVLVGRAVYIQIIGAGFYQQQGEMRYGRTLDLPASRGRIVDRNGQILATSITTPSIWAIPKGMGADRAGREKLARLLGMTPPELDKRLAENANFVWLRRQVDESLWLTVNALGLKGVYQVAEYRRQYPEGEAASRRPP